MVTSTKIRTSIDLSPGLRDKMIALLNQELADTFDLFSQTKQAHWNVKGMQFFPLHELFDNLAGGLVAFIDMIAERATALGGLAEGTARMAAKASRLPELPLDLHGGKAFLEALITRYATVAKSVRAGIATATDGGDLDTADLLTEVSRALDKDLWFLEAHLQD